MNILKTIFWSCLPAIAGSAAVVTLDSDSLHSYFLGVTCGITTMLIFATVFEQEPSDERKAD